MKANEERCFEQGALSSISSASHLIHQKVIFLLYKAVRYCKLAAASTQTPALHLQHLRLQKERGTRCGVVLEAESAKTHVYCHFGWSESLMLENTYSLWEPICHGWLHWPVTLRGRIGIYHFSERAICGCHHVDFLPFPLSLPWFPATLIVPHKPWSWPPVLPSYSLYLSFHASTANLPDGTMRYHLILCMSTTNPGLWAVILGPETAVSRDMQTFSLGVTTSLGLLQGVDVPALGLEQNLFAGHRHTYCVDEAPWRCL